MERRSCLFSSRFSDGVGHRPTKPRSKECTPSPSISTPELPCGPSVPHPARPRATGMPCIPPRGSPPAPAPTPAARFASTPRNASVAMDADGQVRPRRRSSAPRDPIQPAAPPGPAPRRGGDHDGSPRDPLQPAAPPGPRRHPATPPPRHPAATVPPPTPPAAPHARSRPPQPLPNPAPTPRSVAAPRGHPPDPTPLFSSHRPPSAPPPPSADPPTAPNPTAAPPISTVPQCTSHRARPPRA